MFKLIPKVVRSKACLEVGFEGREWQAVPGRGNSPEEKAQSLKRTGDLQVEVEEQMYQGRDVSGSKTMEDFESQDEFVLDVEGENENRHHLSSKRGIEDFVSRVLDRN